MARVSNLYPVIDKLGCGCCALVDNEHTPKLHYVQWRPSSRRSLFFVGTTGHLVFVIFLDESKLISFFSIERLRKVDFTGNPRA